MSVKCRAAKTLAAVLALCFLVTALAYAESGIVTVVQDDVYDRMLEYADNQEFNEVVELCKQLAGYKDSSLYLIYAQGRVSIEQALYNDAAILFSTLIFADFLDSAAWSAYAQGMISYTEQDYAAAAEHFEDAQGVADSTLKLVEIYRILDEEDIILLSDLRCEYAGADSLSIAWDDAGQGHRYIVSYAPQFVVKGAEVITVDTPSVELSGLIPGTDYSVRVQIEDMTRQVSELVAKTEQPLIDGLSEFSLRDIRLFRYDRNDEKKYGLEKLVEHSKTLMTEVSDGVLSLPEAHVLSTNIGHIVVALLSVNGTDVQGTIDVRVVLRLNKYGTYQTQSSFFVSEQASRFVSVYLTINDILDEIYTQQEIWPQAAGSLELYVDGVLMGSSSLTIS